MNRYVQVQFQRNNEFQGETYSYNLVENLELNVDDVIIVETKYGMQIAKVASFSEFSTYKGELKDVVAKVDLTDYYRRKELQKRKAFVKEELEKKSEELTWTPNIKTLAEGANAKEVLDLLEEYCSIKQMRGLS